MALRTMNHFLQYGEPIIKRTVPLAIGLLRISNPEVQSMDMLVKLSYDSDKGVAKSSIPALGLIGAGTNNSRVAGSLRDLATYYATAADVLFVVRVSQGLIHLGKGMLGLSPMHSNKFLFSNGQYHYFLYYLVLAMYPRMLVTLNEKLETV